MISLAFASPATYCAGIGVLFSEVITDLNYGTIFIAFAPYAFIFPSKNKIQEILQLSPTEERDYFN